MLTLVIGGARSGKSRFALSLASHSQRVAYIATARCNDDEMVERVARHREERPAQWVTVESPLEIGDAVERHAGSFEFLVLDCLTLWLSNFSWEHRELSAGNLHAAALRELARATEAVGDSHLVMVTNEIGCGLVPESPLGRHFRDLHGWMNQEAARSADWVYHVVAGIAVPIEEARGVPMIQIPRIVIGGTHSGVGKTTIATALMAAFARRGLRVQPFKVGPDFIDPGFHEAACGRASRNLDGWMLSRTANLEMFARVSADADLALIEGVMGLFDGREASADTGSTAEMAKWLGAPVLLVADASAMARSAAALVRGFETFDPAVDLAGVVFNRIGGQRHADLLNEALGAYCRSTPVGSLPRNEKIGLPSRHLGLMMAHESLTADCLTEMVVWVEKHVDLDALLGLARQRSKNLEVVAAKTVQRATSGVRIGVARDRAFCFYYQDNLDLLRECGADLVEFSPLADEELPPDIQGVYIGGGYPEIHALRLSENRPMLRAFGRFAEAGAPIYAECGGFMYLTEAIVDVDGQEFPMVGLFPTRARMRPRLTAMGYRQPQAMGNTLWLDANESPRGHEFRYSAMDPMSGEVARTYREPVEGYSIRSVLGSYVHLHFHSCPGFAERFVQTCREWSGSD